MKVGKKYNLEKEEKELYEKIFNFKINRSNILEVYYEIYFQDG